MKDLILGKDVMRGVKIAFTAPFYLTLTLVCATMLTEDKNTNAYYYAEPVGSPCRIALAV